MIRKRTHILFLLYATSLNVLVMPNQDLLTQGKTALQQKNEYLARTSFAKVLEADPTNFEALYYLGVTDYYAHNGNICGNYFKKCLAINPQNDLLLQTAGIVFGDIGDFDAARDCLEALYDKNRNNGTCITKLLPIYLRNMDWYYADKFCKVNDLWWYNEDLKNKTVLLDLSSQWNGLGDILQIIRYATHLHTAGARVIVQVRPELIPLLSHCPYIAQLLPNGAEKPQADKTYSLTTDRCVLRMSSLMYSPSKEVPYIYPDKKRLAKWESFFKADSQLNVGICFQSVKMVDYFTGKIIPGPRAFELEKLKPLLALKNVSFYSLQKGEDAAIQSIKKEGYNLVAFPALDDDGTFLDTAAIMKHLDLIITVDTSIAHLAGALGVPVWVMLPYSADFRWFRDRSDSPLYPTMRLFRQKKQGEWEPVIAQIADLLKP